MAFCIRKIYRGCDVLKLGSKFIRSSDCRYVTTKTTEADEPLQDSVLTTGKHTERSPSGDDVLYDASASISGPSVRMGDASAAKEIPRNMRFHYPEFIPHPHIPWRNPVKEKLERRDMLARRTQIHIPEFYVGSIMKVVKSNIHQYDKYSEFVGICLRRDGTGLRATFSLRNVIDNLGIEINYRLYDPTIRSIEVLRLEKRLDDDLGYLRDALPEYCTFPLDMKAEGRRGDDVPVNPIKVKLKPRPWFFPWHKRDYKGIDNIEALLSKKMIVKHKKHVKPWEKYDLMQQYRRSIPEEEQEEIFSEVVEDLEKISSKHYRRGKK